jgi:hypothetical protein
VFAKVFNLVVMIYSPAEGWLNPADLVQQGRVLEGYLSRQASSALPANKPRFTEIGTGEFVAPGMGDVSRLTMCAENPEEKNPDVRPGLSAQVIDTTMGCSHSYSVLRAVCAGRSGYVFKAWAQVL